MAAANYGVVLDILRERFGDQQLIVTTLYCRLADILACGTNFSEIKATINTIERLLRQLSALGEDLDVQRVLTQWVMTKFSLSFDDEARGTKE